MKVVVKVQDTVALAAQFEAAPAVAMRQLMKAVRDGAQEFIERVMEAELELFLGRSKGSDNKRNGFTTRTFAFKGFGEMRLRVPRDRQGRFESQIVPKGRRYDEAIEKDLALLHLAGLSTRVLSHVSKRVLGMRVSAKEISNSLPRIVPAAKAFLERPLQGGRYKYLYIDGTNFKVRRTTVDLEPTLVVVGVDYSDRKSILAMVGGSKENRSAWEMVFTQLKSRGLLPDSVLLGIMDGLPGLESAFLESFPKAQTARCWVHKARNVFPRVPGRYQSEFKSDWDKIQYASSSTEARNAAIALISRWSPICKDAVDCFEKDLEALLVHYEFPENHWDALRTTNPIERVNREFKRRSKSMDSVSENGLKVLLAFTALRLEYGWQSAPIGSAKLRNLRSKTKRGEERMETAAQSLLN